MKNKIGVLKMAFTFAGCFLGAGYVSGQELWQYFGSYGPVGFAGLTLAIALLVVITVIVMDLAMKTGKTGMSDLVVRKDIPWLKALFSLMEVFLFFGIGSIMIAGIGNLFVSLLGLPAYIACAVATAISAVIGYFGLEGMVAVFSSTSPFLVVTAFIICILRLKNVDITGISCSGGTLNPMLGPWYFSAVNYTALNIFGSIALLSPLGNYVEGGRKGIIKGTVIGGAALLVMALFIIFALYSLPESVTDEMPMLTIAGTVGPAASWIYAVLIFVAMLGIAQSCTVAVSRQLETHFAPARKHKKLEFFIMAILLYLASLMGFSGLVGFVYPIFGYIGIVSIILVVEHYVSWRRSK